GRPDSNTSRVARSNNSTGYFLALGMTDLSFRQADPGIEVSVKPGMAHPVTSDCAAVEIQGLAHRAADDGAPREES
ncbi:MAG: hypothetical protein ACYDA3_14550, partial [Gaiellaceae bacterium]